MRYLLSPLFCRPWTLNGMTPRLIESHYEINYGGAVKRLNAITAELEAIDPASARPEVIPPAEARSVHGAELDPAPRALFRQSRR